MQTKAFVVEESFGSKEILKDDMTRAVYSGKFSDYIITRPHLLSDMLIVTDMINGRDKVDIINSSIKELVFSDCVKNFDEICSKISQDKLDESGENFKFEVVKEPISDPKKSFLSYKFKEEIKILDEAVRSVKIFINGYNENSDSVYLNLQMLDEKSEYRYKITSDTIEISITTNMQASRISEFLATFTYKKISSSIKSLKEIYIVINDKLSHKLNIEI